MAREISDIMNDLFLIARDVTPVASARLAAAIVYKNDILSVGINSLKTHPFQKKFSRHEDSIYLHAENCAIKNFLKYNDQDLLRKSTLLVMRAKKLNISHKSSKKFEWGLSKPCLGCMSCIEKYEIKNIIYSTDVTGKYEYLN